MITLRNAKVLDLPEWRDLFCRGIQKSAWSHLSCSEALAILRNLILDPKAGVLVELADTTPKAFAIVQLPASPLDTTPQVVHIYNEGLKSHRRNLVQGIVDFVAAAGYNKLWALDFTGKSKAWDRAMKPEGWTLKPVGRIVEIDKWDKS